MHVQDECFLFDQTYVAEMSLCWSICLDFVNIFVEIVVTYSYKGMHLINKPKLSSRLVKVNGVRLRDRVFGAPIMLELEWSQRAAFVYRLAARLLVSPKRKWKPDALKNANGWGHDTQHSTVRKRQQQPNDADDDQAAAAAAALFFFSVSFFLLIYLFVSKTNDKIM